MNTVFRAILALVALVALGWAGSACAWGSQGHQLVGATADRLLTPNAAAHVKTELGMPLKIAATWPDCVRAVNHLKGKFTYVADPRFRIWCGVFETTAREAAMVDYAGRNWNACVDDDKGRPCNAKYHYADVSLQRDHYQAGQVGTGDHDVVHAIEAAILRLQDKPVPAPFSIRTKAEALFMLTHFVGDIHQPLHMGAAYLDAAGAQIDPDATPGDHKANRTQGGNAIMHGSQDLHGEWDEILPSLGLDPTPDVLAQARATPATPGEVNAWPEAWATDSLLASRQAYAGLTFSARKPFLVRGRSQLAWPAVSADQKGYNAAKRALQAQQIAKAGKRLADVLNTLWP